MPSGWPSAIAPPFGLTCAASSATPSCAQHRQRLRGERLVQLDHVDVVERAGRPRQQLLRRRHGADAHDARRDARRRQRRRRARAASGHARSTAASDAISSAQAPSLTPEALPAVTVPSVRNGVGSLASSSSVVSRADARRARRRSGSPLPLRNCHRRRSRRRTGRALRAAARCWLAQRERVLVGARDLELLGDVLGRLGHRIDAVLRLHQRVHEAPADRRVEDLGVAREKASVALPITNGARDMLSTPPAIIEVGFAGPDRARGACRPRPCPSRTAG